MYPATTQIDYTELSHPRAHQNRCGPNSSTGAISTCLRRAARSPTKPSARNHRAIYTDLRHIIELYDYITLKKENLRRAHLLEATITWTVHTPGRYGERCKSLSTSPVRHGIDTSSPRGTPLSDTSSTRRRDAIADTSSPRSSSTLSSST